MEEFLFVAGTLRTFCLPHVKIDKIHNIMRFFGKIKELYSELILTLSDIYALIRVFGPDGYLDSDRRHTQ